jgi:hypothetical protein
MTHDEIRAFVAENSRIAEQQRARWDAVDPSRLLEACAIITDLLDRLSASKQPPNQPNAVFDGVYLTNISTKSSRLGGGLADIELTFASSRSQLSALAHVQLLINNVGHPVRIEISRL